MAEFLDSTLRHYSHLFESESVSKWNIMAKNWHLGFTSFGGPPVHFQILHRRFVEKYKWVDEQLYQEIFALSQALPGPASTKMLFCINYIHGGLLAGILSLVLWCLPGAVGMYALSLGVSKIGDTLPDLVYALLSGLNAATVGIIALAAVQLAQKAITDRLTRLLVCFGGIGGMLYTALWFYPVLMLAAGVVTIVWDFRWLHHLVNPILRRQQGSEQSHVENAVIRPATASSRSGGRDQVTNSLGSGTTVRRTTAIEGREAEVAASEVTVAVEESRSSERFVPSSNQVLVSTWKTGLYTLIGFIASFAIVMALRGTIIFGGGPVVIPLLREYIVAEDWVSPRDFLLGLALIQSFPGPNFNFAVYLGSLAAAGSSLPSIVGALIGLLAIFTPGIIIVTGILGLWNILRSRRWLFSFLRGINAAAVGLVFTAVYKLWQIGLVNVDAQSGSPLGGDPWWVAITAISFVGGAWFDVSAPFAIVLGGVLGLAWYGVVGGS